MEDAQPFPMELRGTMENNSFVVKGFMLCCNCLEPSGDNFTKGSE